MVKGKLGYLIFDDDPDLPEVKFTKSSREAEVAKLQGITVKRIVYFEVEDGDS